MQHFLDNEEERNVSNSGSESYSDDEPYWDSAASKSSSKYAEPTSLVCTSTRSLKVNNSKLLSLCMIFIATLLSGYYKLQT